MLTPYSLGKWSWCIRIITNSRKRKMPQLICTKKEPFCISIQKLSRKHLHLGSSPQRCLATGSCQAAPVSQPAPVAPQTPNSTPTYSCPECSIPTGSSWFAHFPHFLRAPAALCCPPALCGLSHSASYCVGSCFGDKGQRFWVIYS